MKEYFVKIKNVIISIFSYGILFILKIMIMTYSHVDSFKKFLTFMKSLIYTLYYGGEQNYINKVLSNSNFKTIEHIAIIIQNYNEHSLLKLVSWIRMFKIKYFTIYDPFKSIKIEESENFKIKINNLFKNKVLFFIF